MKIKQIKTILLVIGLVLSSAVSLVTIGTGGNMVQAYKCLGTTSGGAPYYFKDGRCWEPNYRQVDAECVKNRSSCTSTYTCGGNPSKKGETCFVRNEADDTPGGSAPVFDDGTAVTNTKCSNGATTADCSKRVCTNNGGRQSCKTEIGYKVPADDVDPTNTDQKKIARDDVFNKCKATGKTDDECNKQADQAATDCTNNADYATCMKNKSTAASGAKCEDGSTPDATTGECADGSQPVMPNDPGGTGINCGEAETVLISCKGQGVQAIGDVLRIAVSVLTIIIGVAAVGGLAWASVIYAKAEDNASEVSEARTLIRNIVIGLLLYGFLIGIINWLIPGGVFG